MAPIFPSIRDFLGFVIQTLLVLVAIAAVWLFYRYVSSIRTQNRLASTPHLADAAIDYVDDVDRRGDLTVPQGTDKGAYKRQLAAQWLQSELKQDGVSMGDEQAQKWIAASFQKHAGDAQPTNRLSDLAQQAVDLTQRLEGAHLLEAPSNVDRPFYLAGLAADWITVELAKQSLTISRDQAMAWVRGEILHRLQLEAGRSSTEERLNKLAEEAVQFVADLRSSGRMSVRPGVSNEDIDSDVATAWLLTEAAKQGLAVTADQIAEAIAAALGQRPGGTNLVLSEGK